MYYQRLCQRRMSCISYCYTKKSTFFLQLDLVCYVFTTRFCQKCRKVSISFSLAFPIVGGRTPRSSSPRRQTSKAFPGRHFGDQRRWYAQDHQPERRSQRVGSRAPHSEVHQQIRIQRRTGVATKCKSLTCFFCFV